MRPASPTRWRTAASRISRWAQYDRSIADYDAGLPLNPDNKADYLYGRGLAKLKKGDTGGAADVAAAKTLHAKIDEEFASYGVK